MNEFFRGRDNKTKEIVDVRDLPPMRRGNACDCSCVKCGKPLQACQGPKRRWYLRHRNASPCDGGGMLAIHLMSQQLLLSASFVQTRYGSVAYRDPIREGRLTPSSFKADVLAQWKERDPIAIEIRVTHCVDESKIAFIRREKIACIEIDLSKVDRSVTTDALRTILLEDTSIQHYIFWPQEQSESGGAFSTKDIEPEKVPQEQNCSDHGAKIIEKPNSWWEFIIAATIIFFALKGFKALMERVNISPRTFRRSNIRYSPKYPRW